MQSYMRKRVFISIIIIICVVGILATLLLINGNNYNNSKVEDSSENSADSVKESVNSIYNITTTSYKDVLNLEKDDSFFGILDDDRPWTPQLVTNEGIVYGHTGYNADKKIDFISYDLNSDDVTIISTIEDNLRPTFIKYNDNYVAWIETIVEYDKMESRLKLFDKQNGDVKTISEFEGVSRDNSSLALGDDYILWIEFYVIDNITYPVIRKYIISTGEYSVYANNASSPVVCKDFIAYLGPDEDDTNQVGLFINNLNTNETEQICNGLNISAIEGNDNTLVISHSQGSSENLSIWEEGKLTNLLKAENANYPFEFPKISDRFVYWRSMSQTMVYDRKYEKVLLIDGENEGLKATISDNYIINAKTVKTMPDGKEQVKSEAVEAGMFFADIYVKKIVQ